MELKADYIQGILCLPFGFEKVTFILIISKPTY
jgi:hypothetical protein